MKRIMVVIGLTLGLIIPINTPVNASVTWSATSPLDSYTRPEVTPKYDVTQVDAAIFDSEQDEIYFYLNFAGVPSRSQYNDGRESFAAIFLDTNLDGKSDYKLYLANVSLETDRTSVSGDIYVVSSDSISDCTLSIFSNIDEDKKWIGFKVLRSCLGLPKTFAIQGYSDYIANDNSAFDYAPEDFFRITLPSTSGAPASSGTGVISPTYELPTNLANASTEAVNFSQAPRDLTLLSASLKLSIVTVYCMSGSGSGWSAKAAMSSKLSSEGYQSYVITNHHVIENCLRTKKVTMLLSNNTTIDGMIISWNESSDVAGIVTKAVIPGLEWIGSTPKQGWWIGVIGSPLGESGILTTGIISSINSNSGTFTLTAAINPGNSGGPAFDSTGRVLGLATSKRLDSNGVLAEGFGNAHGVTLLCATIFSCTLEKNPWGATARFSEAADLKAKQEAEAKVIADKAAAELKAKQEADAKAAAELKAKQEADAKAAADKAVAEKLIADAKVEAARILAEAQAQVAAELRAKQEADAKAASEKIVADAKAEAARILAATKKTTITCVKGKVTKKVTALKPKCPTGYKKK
jgi:S1-C subfamily serine protease